MVVTSIRRAFGVLRILRPFATVGVLVCACSALAAAAIPKNDLSPPLPLTFSDGAVATPYDHCGDGDLCATIAYPGGDSLFMYSEGASCAQPYVIEFVRVHEEHTLFEFSRPLNHVLTSSNVLGTRVQGCGGNLASQLTLDHGLVHLTIDNYPDGSLRFEFTPVKGPSK